MHRPEQEKREQLIRNLFENIGLIKRSMYSQLEASHGSLPIPMSQLELLVTIQHRQPVSFKDLARHLYLTPGAISQVAEALEQEGYVTRENDPKDRRVQCLRISKKGAKLLADTTKRRQAILKDALEDLTNEELELWLRVQTKLMKRFQAKQDRSEDKEAK